METTPTDANAEATTVCKCKAGFYGDDCSKTCGTNEEVNSTKDGCVCKSGYWYANFD